MLAGVVATVGTYLYVDRQIVSRLVYHRLSGAPVILTDAWRVPHEKIVSREQMLIELNSRSYREVAGEPSNPGEYRLEAGKITVHTREFIAADGATVPATISMLLETEQGFRVDTQSGLSLEPEVLSYLGAGDVRASRYRSLREIPSQLSNAVIAVEDERFFHHWGIDLIGIARALLVNLRAGKIVQGGSTLTQQLAKNLLFTPQRTLGRKILEAFAAISLENRYTKEEILELYLNDVYLGQEGAVAIHGMSEAARAFFGKDLKELELGELTMLAAIIRAPSYYSPRKNLERAVSRRDTVLDKMLELKMINQRELSRAKVERVRVSTKNLERARMSAHFVAAVSQQLGDYFNVDAALRSGLTVYTGIQREMQRCAEDAVHSGLEKLEKELPSLKRQEQPLEAALLAIEPFSGKIRAWVGGRNYGDNQFDHVMQAKRQIGSTIKPFLYLTALDAGLNTYRPATALTILPDEPLKFDLAGHSAWEPENYDHKFRGDVTLRYALEQSLNMPAAYLATRVGLRAFADVLTRFHVSEHPQQVPALALGATDTTLYNLTSAYAALANGGTAVSTRPFLSARDSENNALAVTSIKEERIADENAVFVLSNILQGVIERGTARGLRSAGYTAQVAGKTGTSNETRDAWFIGFHPGLVAGVWVGYDDNDKTGLTGGRGAVPIWASFMNCAAKIREPVAFVQPPGVAIASIDRESFGLATPECPDESVIREYFVHGTEPTRYCSLHGGRYAPEERSPKDRFEPAPTRSRRSVWDILLGR